MPEGRAPASREHHFALSLDEVIPLWSTRHAAVSMDYPAVSMLS